jgi:hypothetical protein
MGKLYQTRLFVRIENWEERTMNAERRTMNEDCVLFIVPRSAFIIRGA